MKRGVTSGAPIDVVVVGTGARGGIGRYELLLRRALDEIQEQGEFRFDFLDRRAKPGYLSSGDSASGEQDEASIAVFSRRVLARVVRERPAMVLYTHYRLARIQPLVRALGVRRAAIVAYGDELWAPIDRLARTVLVRAAGVLSISKFTAAEVERVQGRPQRRTAITPLALDPDWLQRVVPRDGRAARSRRILTVTRLEAVSRYKGVDDVIRALPSVLGEFPDAHFDIVGDGDDRAYLEDLVAELGLQSAVTFHGFVSDEALAERYRHAGLFTLPSREEGFGLVYLEAMAYALPVVALRAGATPEVVEHETSGLLAREGDDLSVPLAALLRDPTRAHQMGMEGRRRAVEDFSFGQFRDAVHEALRAASAGIAGR